MIKTIRLILVLVLMAVVGSAVLISAKPKKRTALDLYSFYGSYVTASNGQFQYTGALALANEKDLKSQAAAASNSGSVILIGNGSGDPGEPVTDIQIVGIGGVAYGNITECPPPEE